MLLWRHNIVNLCQETQTERETEETCCQNIQQHKIFIRFINFANRQLSGKVRVRIKRCHTVVPLAKKGIRFRLAGIVCLHKKVKIFGPMADLNVICPDYSEHLLSRMLQIFWQIQFFQSSAKSSENLFIQP